MNSMKSSTGLIAVAAIILATIVIQAQTQREASVQMVSVEGEGAKYWPRWRGPSGQGLVTGTGYPDKWSATQNVLWKTPVPGTGNSSPIVWGDRIILTSSYDGGRRLSVLAYRRSDGSLLWETFAPEGAAASVHANTG